MIKPRINEMNIFLLNIPSYPSCATMLFEVVCLFLHKSWLFSVSFVAFVDRDITVYNPKTNWIRMHGFLGKLHNANITYNMPLGHLVESSAVQPVMKGQILGYLNCILLTQLYFNF